MSTVKMKKLKVQCLIKTLEISSSSLEIASCVLSLAHLRHHFLRSLSIIALVFISCALPCMESILLISYILSGCSSCFARVSEHLPQMRGGGFTSILYLPSSLFTYFSACKTQVVFRRLKESSFGFSFFRFVLRG